MFVTSEGRRRVEPALRLLLAAIFVVAGGMKRAASEFEVSNVARFGYTPWFMYAVSLAQLLGGVLLRVRDRVAYGALLSAAQMPAAASVTCEPAIRW